jgi:hypothetical protein
MPKWMLLMGAFFIPSVGNERNCGKVPINTISIFFCLLRTTEVPEKRELIGKSENCCDFHLCIQLRRRSTKELAMEFPPRIMCSSDLCYKLSIVLLSHIMLPRDGLLRPLLRNCNKKCTSTTKNYLFT